jgi:hypothetical protein
LFSERVFRKVSEMAKASRFYYGNDTYGRPVETAQRASDEKWFSRSYVFNGFGKAWSKWTEDKAPTQFNDQECEWGFKKLSFCNPRGVRLPNAVEALLPDNDQLTYFPDIKL